MQKTLDLYGKISFKVAGKDFIAEHFSSLSRDNLEKIFQWRIAPSVSQWMYTADFDLTSHLKFAKKLKYRKDAFYWVLSESNNQLGVFDITKISSGGGDLGLYSAPGVKGAGCKLMNALFYFGFALLDLKELRAEVYEENISANRLYLRVGMTLVNKLSTSSAFSSRNILVYSITPKMIEASRV